MNKKRKPITYPNFSSMDPNDPLIKALGEHRPYEPSDFYPKPTHYMFVRENDRKLWDAFHGIPDRQY